MSNEITSNTARIRPECLEDWLRPGAGTDPAVLEEEVTEFLGRAKSASGRVQTGSGYRNGHSRSRKLTLSSGTRVRRPRVRDTEERFDAGCYRCSSRGADRSPS